MLKTKDGAPNFVSITRNGKTNSWVACWGGDTEQQTGHQILCGPQVETTTSFQRGAGAGGRLLGGGGGGGGKTTDSAPDFVSVRRSKHNNLLREGGALKQQTGHQILFLLLWN